MLETGAALNHLRWHQSGHVIAAGDDVGHIYLHDVAEVGTFITLANKDQLAHW